MRPDKYPVNKGWHRPQLKNLLVQLLDLSPRRDQIVLISPFQPLAQDEAVFLMYVASEVIGNGLRIGFTEHAEKLPEILVADSEGEMEALMFSYGVGEQIMDGTEKVYEALGGKPVEPVGDRFIDGLLRMARGSGNEGSGT